MEAFAEEYGEIHRVYVDSAMEGDLFRSTEALLICERLQQSGVEVYLAMPHIFRDETEALFTAQCREDPGRI